MSGATTPTPFQAAISQAKRYAGEAAGAWGSAERLGAEVTLGDSGIPCTRAAEYYVRQAQVWADLARALVLQDLVQATRDSAP